jgi:hypoxanthine-DNA glycosylase
MQVKSEQGFAPIVGSGAKLLILGSLPSQMSLKSQQYYGNPQNKFWSIMGALFAAGPELPYSMRVDRLIACNVAVWDVLQSSVRPGSLDAAIDVSTAVANDFASFFARQPGIRLVCFNGKKASQLFARLVEPELDDSYSALRFANLPSTSPAHAAMSIDEKLERWSILKDVTESG